MHLLNFLTESLPTGHVQVGGYPNYLKLIPNFSNRSINTHFFIHMISRSNFLTSTLPGAMITWIILAKVWEMKSLEVCKQIIVVWKLKSLVNYSNFFLVKSWKATPSAKTAETSHCGNHLHCNGDWTTDSILHHKEGLGSNLSIKLFNLNVHTSQLGRHLANREIPSLLVKTTSKVTSSRRN